MNEPRLSIIVPCLNEGAIVAEALHRLQFVRQQGYELILVDGGSNDDTRQRAEGLVDKLIIAPRGRARQMNAGVAEAQGSLLWFLHLDTEVSLDALDDLLATCGDDSRCWGRFDVRLSGRAPLLRVVERMMNLRSRLTGIATGDQGIFVTRGLFEQVGGWPDIPLMEDIALSRLLRQASPPQCLADTLITSSRRWERNGIWRTILRMWWLRLRFAMGADPARLAEDYGSCSSPKVES